MRDILKTLLTEHAPFHSTLPFAQAVTALRDLLGRKLAPASPEHAAALETMRRVREEWQRATYRGYRRAEVPCPACTNAWISLARASDHLPLCPGLPAYARLEAAVDALTLRFGADGEVRELLGEAAVWLGEHGRRRTWPAYRGTQDVDAALGRLADERDAPFTDGDAAIVNEVFSEWARTHFPRADTCTFCNAVTPLEERLAHLLACPGHPVARCAAKLEAALQTRLGEPVGEALLGAFTLRNTPRDELRELVQSCRRYEECWGWRGPGLYKSRTECEDPWLVRVDRAEEALGVPMPETAPPPEVASDVERLREEAKRWRTALKALWKECRGLWALMDDDERGRSLIPEHIVPPWKRAIDEAKELLGRGS